MALWVIGLFITLAEIGVDPAGSGVRSRELSAAWDQRRVQVRDSSSDNCTDKVGAGHPLGLKIVFAFFRVTRVCTPFPNTARLFLVDNAGGLTKVEILSLASVCQAW